MTLTAQKPQTQTASLPNVKVNPKQEIIYLSGKISGLHSLVAYNKFKAKQKWLEKEYNAKVINPIEKIAAHNASLIRQGKKPWNDDQNRKAIMALCIRNLSLCDSIYIMPCWEDSEGAQAELAFAIAANMKIRYELEAVEEEGGEDEEL